MRSPAPPGNDREEVEVKALACSAVDGWVVRDSIFARRILHRGSKDQDVRYCFT